MAAAREIEMGEDLPATIVKEMQESVRGLPVDVRSRKMRTGIDAVQYAAEHQIRFSSLRVASCGGNVLTPRPLACLLSIPLPYHAPNTTASLYEDDMEEVPTSLSSNDIQHEESNTILSDNAITDTSEQHTAFLSQWHPIDTANLAPYHLPVSKIQRAWDRQPQSPFSRKRVRFGKVWKRANAPSIVQSSGLFGALNKVVPVGNGSPAKVVKKLRVDGHGKELIRDWEGRGSPATRRIVTRSNATEEPLLVLDVEQNASEHFEEVERDLVTKVEISYEDGTVEEGPMREALAQDDWEDEGTAEQDEGELSDLSIRPDPCVANEEKSEELGLFANVLEPVVVCLESAAPEKKEHLPEKDVDLKEDAEGTAVRAYVAVSPEAQEVMAQSPTIASNTGTSQEMPHGLAIPEGFVSPFKSKRRPVSERRKQLDSKRRRTLPENFSAQNVGQTESGNTQLDIHDLPQKASSQAAGILQTIEDIMQPSEEVTDMLSTEAPTMDTETVATSHYIEGDGQWEDIEEEDRILTPEPTQARDWISTTENTPTTPSDTEQEQTGTLQVNPTITAIVEGLEHPSKSLTFQGDAILDQQPRLPLRHSPRRRSSSPRKRNTTLLTTERSHLVAFTPIKYPGAFGQSQLDLLVESPPLDSSEVLLKYDVLDVPPPQLTRSSSAPPEEPQMSPRKQVQPRMSDDTATLQAFIKRAAESKHDRRVLALDPESLNNPSTLRQALSSPGARPVPMDVLADLDPNSPVPRKQSKAGDCQEKQAASYDDEEPSSPTGKPSRRSGRTKKLPQVLPATTFSGRKSISLSARGNGIVVKKTEAQELYTLTNNNTRKNKGGAVLPSLKLISMDQEEEEKGEEVIEEPSTIATEINGPKRKGVRWNEELVSFYQGNHENEVSMMSDELNEPEPRPVSTTAQIVGVPTAPPPGQTPSKPKLRRLKPPRTASTITEAAASVEAQPTATPSDIASDALPRTKRRTRIATPAKINGASLLPDGVLKDDEPPVRPVTSRRKMVSKLPAPTPAASGLSHNKENSLIASPPKKRAKAASTAGATSSHSSKALLPKLDLAKPLTVPEKVSIQAPEFTASLSSPAKKGLTTAFIGNFDENGQARAGKEDLPPSLGSPAKKRTRKLLG